MKTIIRVRTTKDLAKPITHLLLNLAMIYAANQLTINVWRSLTGH
jgi:cob(I)alamin adenosyltransferase